MYQKVSPLDLSQVKHYQEDKQNYKNSSANLSPKEKTTKIILKWYNRDMTKTIWKSKKFWVNILTIIVAFAAHFGVTPEPELTGQVATAMILLSPAINLVLTMFYTKQPIALK